MLDEVVCAEVVSVLVGEVEVGATVLEVAVPQAESTTRTEAIVENRRMCGEARPPLPTIWNTSQGAASTTYHSVNLFTRR